MAPGLVASWFERAVEPEESEPGHTGHDSDPVGFLSLRSFETALKDPRPILCDVLAALAGDIGFIEVDHVCHHRHDYEDDTDR